MCCDSPHPVRTHLAERATCAILIAPLPAQLVRQSRPLVGAGRGGAPGIKVLGLNISSQLCVDVMFCDVIIWRETEREKVTDRRQIWRWWRCC